MTNPKKPKNKYGEIKEPIKWDKKSTINLMILVSSFVLSFLIYDNRYNLKGFIFRDKYQNTKGKIERFESVQIPYQSRYGQEIMTKYRVEYSYYVCGKRYGNIEMINSNPNNAKQVIIQYYVENPKYATIKIE